MVSAGFALQDPTTADAWITALSHFGTMSFGEVASAAIRFASEGFPMYPLMSEFIAEVNRSRSEASATKDAMQNDLARVERQIKRLVNAILDCCAIIESIVCDRTAILDNRKISFRFNFRWRGLF